MKRLGRGLGDLFTGAAATSPARGADDSEHSVLDSPDSVPAEDRFDLEDDEDEDVSSASGGVGVAVVVGSSCESSMADLLRTSSADLQGTDGSGGEMPGPHKASMQVADSPSTEAVAAAEQAETAKALSTGRQLLTQTLEQVKRSLEELTPPPLSARLSPPGSAGAVPETRQAAKLRAAYTRNLVVLCAGFFCVYTAFFALRNLQSSINHDRNLGLISLACVYASFVVGCFFAASIVPRVTPKYVMVWSCLGHVLYTGANFYPSFVSLVPASLLLGLSMAHLWTAQGTYVTSLGATYAAVTARAPEAVLALFNGTFLVVMLIGNIVGNMLASAVLTVELEGKDADPAAAGGLLQGSTNTTSLRLAGNLTWDAEDVSWLGACGASHSPHHAVVPASPEHVHRHMVLVLLGVFASLNVIGVVILAAFLDKLDVIVQPKSRGGSASRGHLFGLLALHRDRRLLLLAPLMLFMGLQEAFVYGEVTQAFVTCPLGVHMVGYAMVCFSGCASLTAALLGQLQAALGRVVIVTAGGLLTAALLVLLSVWEPAPGAAVGPAANTGLDDADLAVVFVLVGALGVCDGVWQTQTAGLCGLLFPRDQEAAFASLRLWEAAGFCVTFSSATMLTLHAKIGVYGAALVVALAGYYSMELSQRRLSRRDSFSEPDSTVEFV